jgi:anti-sigma B factor antagonist/stage II sporulation protein AA (anti-sigma F factor antagonist)
MDMRARTQGNTLILKPLGRIDQSTADAFTEALAPHLENCNAGKLLVLDFSDIEYVSSAGLRALILASRKANTQRGFLAIAAPTPLVSELFIISRVNLVFHIFDSVDSAITELT